MNLHLTLETMSKFFVVKGWNSLFNRHIYTYFTLGKFYYQSLKILKKMGLMEERGEGN
jgi:hypothetical protein